MVSTALLASLVGWAELSIDTCQADAGRERQLIQRLRSLGSDEERLRSIDAVILSQETGLELRSALRKMSINDPSPEVRGAARFALVKLQAMAPPSTECACVGQDQPAVALRNWKPKETVEQINEPMVDGSVVPTKGPLTKLGEQLGIKRANREIPAEVVVIESQPVDAARITAVATTGDAVVKREDEVVMTAIPIPTAQARSLPPMETKESKELPPMKGVITAIQEKLKQSPTAPALEPLSADEQAARTTADEIAAVPVPTILPGKQVAVPSPALAEPTKAAIVDSKLSTIPWPKVPPKATPSDSTADVATTSPPSLPTPPAEDRDFVVAPMASRAAGIQPTTTAPATPAPAAITSVRPAAGPMPPSSPSTVTTMKPVSPNAYAGDIASKGWPADSNKEVAPLLKTKPLIDLTEIPTGNSGRQQMARELLDRGRELAKSGQWSEAESVLFRVRELAVNYRRWNYQPEDLERDIMEARQRERLARGSTG
jgi:hypothetical protein